MKTLINKILVAIILTTGLTTVSINSVYSCVNPYDICKDNPDAEPQSCCDGDNGEKYSCQELTAGYFTCEKEEPPEN